MQSSKRKQEELNYQKFFSILMLNESVEGITLVTYTWQQDMKEQTIL